MATNKPPTKQKIKDLERDAILRQATRRRTRRKEFADKIKRIQDVRAISAEEFREYLEQYKQDCEADGELIDLETMDMGFYLNETDDELNHQTPPKPSKSPKSSKSSKPAESLNPAESSNPAEFSQPAESPKPAESSNPAESSKPAEASNTADDLNATESLNPAGASNTAESLRPTEPLESGEGAYEDEFSASPLSAEQFAEFLANIHHSDEELPAAKDIEVPLQSGAKTPSGAGNIQGQSQSARKTVRQPRKPSAAQKSKPTAIKTPRKSVGKAPKQSKQAAIKAPRAQNLKAVARRQTGAKTVAKLNQVTKSGLKKPHRFKPGSK
jgi:DNA-directed RNA polymerase delta subunit